MRTKDNVEYSLGMLLWRVEFGKVRPFPSSSKKKVELAGGIFDTQYAVSAWADGHWLRITDAYSSKVAAFSAAKDYWTDIINRAYAEIDRLKNIEGNNQSYIDLSESSIGKACQQIENLHEKEKLYDLPWHDRLVPVDERMEADWFLAGR